MKKSAVTAAFAVMLVGAFSLGSALKDIATREPPPPSIRVHRFQPPATARGPYATAWPGVVSYVWETPLGEVTRIARESKQRPALVEMIDMRTGVARVRFFAAEGSGRPTERAATPRGRGE